MDAGLDTGDIVSERKTAIRPEDNAQTLHDRLAEKGVEPAKPVSDEGWGLVAQLKVPGAGKMGLYEPRHPSPLTGPG
jgi:hypothetical protein